MNKYNVILIILFLLALNNLYSDTIKINLDIDNNIKNVDISLNVIKYGIENTFWEKEDGKNNYTSSLFILDNLQTETKIVSINIKNYQLHKFIDLEIIKKIPINNSSSNQVKTNNHKYDLSIACNKQFNEDSYIKIKSWLDMNYPNLNEHSDLFVKEILYVSEEIEKAL